jgi:hypothetical protein
VLASVLTAFTARSTQRVRHDSAGHGHTWHRAGGDIMRACAALTRDREGLGRGDTKIHGDITQTPNESGAVVTWGHEGPTLSCAHAYAHAGNTLPSRPDVPTLCV